MTYGWISGEQGTSNKNLQWMVGQRSLWKTEWKPDVWHNVAYEIVGDQEAVDYKTKKKKKKRHLTTTFSSLTKYRTLAQGLSAFGIPKGVHRSRESLLQVSLVQFFSVKSTLTYVVYPST